MAVPAALPDRLSPGMYTIGEKGANIEPLIIN
jgi:hypothetical protein